MGHNWWAVIVGGAGAMAALLSDDALAARIAAVLSEWAHYPGNVFSRKQPNFGPEGDYIEGFGYAEYGLQNVFIFSHLYPSLKVVPNLLTAEQARGLARWLRRSILPVKDGFHSLRFGNIPLSRTVRPEVWHSLAELAGDEELLWAAHQARPTPKIATELLLWKQPPNDRPARPSEPLAIFSTSGVAFLERGTQFVAIRSGEFWNHNHLDAGTFVFQDGDVTWIDDAGTCTYSRSELADYYITPRAHNVAYCPELVPPIRRAQYEGLSSPGRFVQSAHTADLSVVCADTNILCGHALLRSYRWFMQLGDEALIVWDDLAAHQEQRFVRSIHSMHAMEEVASNEIMLRADGKSCRVFCFCDRESQSSIAPALMGEIPDKFGQDVIGHEFAQHSAPATRTKFGMAIGTQLLQATWATLERDGGWLCELQTTTSRWRIWFNPLADGRINHQNSIARWNTFTTDGYALAIRERAGQVSSFAVNASFVRDGETVLHSTLARVPLTQFGNHSPG